MRRRKKKRQGDHAAEAAVSGTVKREKSNYSSDALTLLLGSYYALPFAAGDDSTDFNATMANALKRKSGSLDRQWRNIRALVVDVDGAGADGNISNILRALVEKYRNDPLAAIRAAYELATPFQAVREYLPNPTTLVPTILPTDQWIRDNRKPDIDLEGVLLQVLWCNPNLAIVDDRLIGADLIHIAERVNSEVRDLTERIRALYALAHRAHVDPGGRLRPLWAARQALLETAPLELPYVARETCQRRSWHIWNHIS
jgi:hypothetical protein